MTNKNNSKTDWKRVKAMTDKDIEEAVASDPDAAPILSPDQIKLQYKPAPARIKSK